MDQLNNHTRRKLLAHMRATQPDCHLCGYPVRLDVDLQRHPLASCGDELTPRAHGGSALDPANVANAHRLCNGIRSTKPITPELRQRCRQAISDTLTTTTRRGW